MFIVCWKEVIEEGIDGGVVMFVDYDGSQVLIDVLCYNVLCVGIMGSLVVNDVCFSMIMILLFDINLQIGGLLNYGEFFWQLEE